MDDLAIPNYKKIQRKLMIWQCPNTKKFVQNLQTQNIKIPNHPNTKYQTPNTKHQIPNTKHQI